MKNQKNFKDEDINENEEVDKDMTKVRGHYRKVCNKDDVCKRVRVKPHTRKKPRKKPKRWRI